jgi:hypothetical protein
MKLQSLVLVSVALMIFFSGCTVSERTPENPDDNNSIEPGPECGDGVCDAGEDCSLCVPDCGLCPPPTEPDFTPPSEIEDECAWTLDIKNFIYEQSPTASQQREYNTCYTNTYILKINSSTEPEFCEKIIDTDFLVECFSVLARKTDSVEVCGQIPEKTVSFSEFSKDVSSTDACYYNYVQSNKIFLDDSAQTAVCSKISDSEFRAYCISRARRQ